ncbi:amino-acid N-acetyltransferase [Bordetella holmesii]|uniref:Amino-acid acetyltransferase n=2 Tax=Bordetella holmesii TaxID=35814 RepID=A0A158M7A0_9BORD|nr:amino-acid N-acetyltransferase [Bordetella holmesii]AHV92403.1 amino-acid N-acetyltransferase [Bordetella holmesii ATCC 51541]AIT27205.1 amino-acid N-acetyltransferase [Bordetella holmesii 44057]EWM47788.1 amino-acid N-acetyltransferase [Bordetella holmesii 35009]EWM51955.1 amino-acid N-acetyltransferase [Bordetella holmesii 70147]AMD46069.1 N-acetylglutamate synthase [Bordetella holmesii H558]
MPDLEADTVSALEAPEFAPAQFVRWFRDVAPYVHAFRGKTFVVAFGGELVQAGALNTLVQDLSLLSALGIRLVLVHGSRPQVNEQLRLKGYSQQFGRGMEPTDAAALECAKEAAGEIRLDIEAAFSQGLPNTPMSNAHVRVISGNFVTARPAGVLDGVDYKHTGHVRKIDVDALKFAIERGSMVLLSPLGFSPTGEAFNLAMEDLATSVAVGLRAEKLIFLSSSPGVLNEDGTVDTELARADADALLAAGQLDEDTAFFLRPASLAVKRGVARAHVVPYCLDGSVLLEIFTHDGVGTMVVEDTLDDLRAATLDDVGAILSLIEPLEADGTLVPRPRGVIERDVEHFTVLEHDGIIYGCAAIYPYPKDNMAEMACLIVHPEWQSSGEGEILLRHMESRARSMGMKRLFVLTTRTSHWFIKRGFVQGGIADLPVDKQQHYNRSRNSLIFIKKL